MEAAEKAKLYRGFTRITAPGLRLLEIRVSGLEWTALICWREKNLTAERFFISVISADQW